MKFKLFCIFVILGLLLVPGIAFAVNDEDHAQIVFYNTNGTTILSVMNAIPLSTDLALGYFISAAVPTRIVSEVSTRPSYTSPTRLHDIPEFVTVGGSPVAFNDPNAHTVIISWKLRNDATNTRYNFTKHAARTAATANYDGFVPLKENEVLHLVPLRTMPIAEFRDLVYKSHVVDGHMDTPNGQWGAWPTNDLTIAGGSNAQGRYDRMKFGGLNGGMFSSYVGDSNLDYYRLAGENRNSRILATANGMEWSAIRNPSVFQIVNTAQGFKDALAADKLGLMHSIEGAYSLTKENYHELLEQYYDLGYRMVSFNHNPNSYLASGTTNANFEAGRQGFTATGELALMRMEELGMVFDISHLDDRSIKDAILIGKNPIIGSHHGAWDFHNNSRNAKDTELVGMALGGGMIFQNYLGGFMKEPQSVSNLVDMMDYMVALCMKPVANGGAGFTREQAVGFIGVGTDYDGGTNIAEVQDASFFYRTHRELLARNYTIPEIKRILGENAFRVYDEVLGKAAAYHEGRKNGAKAVITNPAANNVSLIRNTTTGHCANVPTRAPIFTANITNAVSARVIVDGLVYPSTLTGGVVTANLTNTPLQEDFHVVTFEAKDDQGKITRATYIFYIGDVPAVHKIEFMNGDGVTFISTVYVNSGDLIAAGRIPTQTTLNLPITGWKHAGLPATHANADVNNLGTTRIVRSYRLVPTVAANNDSDIRIQQAKAAIDNASAATFTVKQVDAPNAAAALAHAQRIVDTLVAPFGVSAVVDGVAPAYTAPIAGTAGDNYGTDGSYVFVAKLTRNGGTPLEANRMLTITATPFKKTLKERIEDKLVEHGCNAGFGYLAMGLLGIFMFTRRSR